MPVPIYRQRPARAALIGALSIFSMGGICCAVVYRRVAQGEVGIEKLYLLSMLTLLMTGLFLVSAFARYRFVHLWDPHYKQPHGHYEKKHRHM